ncbi:MAG: cupin domain-containing protein [Methanomassiliicoccus sp.]|nr:cupin domain-containing protein [Methanomassiliicoccus sp.]
MRMAHEADIGCERRPGQKGAVLACDLLDEENFLLGVRWIEPDSVVPQRPHRHPLKQANYVIEGTGTVTNGREMMAFGPGDILLMEGDEEHYFSTSSGIKMLEIRYL